MNEFFKTSDGVGASALTPPLAKRVNHYSLSANTAKTVNWPAEYTFCNINSSTGEPFYCRVGGTAVVPTNDVTDGSGSSQSPAQRRKGQESSFSVISTNAQILTIEFWKGKSE